MKSNCENCGATLAFDTFKDRLRCDYCATVHLPSLRDNLGLDVISDTASKTPCPHCAKALSHGKIDQWPVLACSACHGLLLSRQDLLKIIVYCRAKTSFTDRKPDDIEPSALARAVVCPVCDVQMSTHPYFGPGDFAIDSCTPCDRVWLDEGELKRSSSIQWAGSVWQ